jgi:putative transcriptional regulator
MTKESMTREKKKPNRLAKALLETARDMRRGELLDDAAYAKITMRHLGENEVPKAEPITGEEIRALREKAHLSQAVFARHLNLTVGYVSQLERGAKRPTGAALVLLNVIRRKGLEVIL